MKARVAILLLAIEATGCCGAQTDATHVFVRDPRQVWVEAWSSHGSASGHDILLPAGTGLKGVSVRAEVPRLATMPTFASVFREPQGGITIDHPACAPWPTNPLSSKGELLVVAPHGVKAFASDGRNLRIPFKCDEGDLTVIDLTFVTPIGNVKEIDVYEDARPGPVARDSSDPALQAHPWEH